MLKLVYGSVLYLKSQELDKSTFIFESENSHTGGPTNMMGQVRFDKIILLNFASWIKVIPYGPFNWLT